MLKFLPRHFEVILQILELYYSQITIKSEIWPTACLDMPKEKWPVCLCTSATGSRDSIETSGAGGTIR